MPAHQTDLFAETPRLPEGLAYRSAILDAAEEADLARRAGELELKPFEFRGYLGLRRVKAFGSRYDYSEGAVRPADEMPAFLLPLRDRAAGLAGLEPGQLNQALVTEYRPGAGIGWHRDRPQFGEVVGVSLLAPCTLRFRRRGSGGWERAKLQAEPRSAYLLSGPARSEWEHSIAPMRELRYSITFRRLLQTSLP
ncbi:MAG TPA: alpha-ketoglutarate-dependent dioxygenase AlkB [Caulobacteraceae bacterium]|nr:alpha-ketoglutarate-dependent dioxygenase AlkB [Caulobacteraceae bacterium]